MESCLGHQRKRQTAAGMADFFLAFKLPSGDGSLGLSQKKKKKKKELIAV